MRSERQGPSGDLGSDEWIAELPHTADPTNPAGLGKEIRKCQIDPPTSAPKIGFFFQLSLLDPAAVPLLSTGGGMWSKSEICGRSSIGLTKPPYRHTSFCSAIYSVSLRDPIGRQPGNMR